MATTEEKIISIKIQTDAEAKGIGELQQHLQRLTKERNELNKASKKGAGLNELQKKRLGQLQPELVATRNKLRDLERQVVKNNDALKKNSGFVAGVKKGMISATKSVALYAGGFLALGRALINTVNIVKNFDEAQGKLRAVTGQTEEQLSSLTKQAKELGATTAFTATQTTEAQIELAKLGFTVNEITKLTPAVLGLAAATGTDLANAATIAGSTVRAFGLDASETERVVDVMANSFTKSSLDIEKFKTAMGNVAPVAKSAGVGVEETTALIGTLTDAGIDASTAGTGLRNVFLELAKSGMTFDEAMVEIQNSTNKNATALDLFGKRGATIGTVLASNTEKTKELTSALNDSAGAAQRMADEQLNTLTGKLTILGSAWEGFILSLESGDGVIGTLVRGSLDGLTKALTQLTHLGSILDITFHGVNDASEESLKTFIKNADAMNSTLDSGMLLSEFLQEFNDKTLQELEENVDQNRIAFVRLAEQQGENTEDSVIMFNAYLNLRRETEALEEETENLVDTTEDLVEVEEKEVKVTKESTIEKEKLAGKMQTIEERRKIENDLIREYLELVKDEDIVQGETIDEHEKRMMKKLELRQQQNQAEIDANKSETESAKRKEQEIHDNRSALLEEGVQATRASAIALATISRNKTNNEIAELKRQKETGTITEIQFQKRANEIRKKDFENQKKLQLAMAAVNLAMAIGRAFADYIYPASIPIAAAAAVAPAIQLAAIASTEYQPQQFAEGGLLSGNSHAAGGIPFTVGGQSGFEAEGGEAIINKKSTSMFMPLLSAINQAGGGVGFDNPVSLSKFAVGGLTPNVPQSGMSIERMVGAMNSRIDRIKVTNVATDTAATANRVNNIQSSASFG